MEQDEIKIRKSRGHYTTIIIAAGLSAGLITMEGLKGGDSAGHVFYVIAGVAMFLGVFFFTIKQWYKPGVEMTISGKGVYLRGKGLYPWDLIDNYSIVESDDPFKTELVLHFREYADEDFDITNMEIEVDEIINLMDDYKQASAPYNASDRYR
ncbi:MAG TPA: hypothetical protein VF008_21825 [Niastella sp.]